jgi:TatD DNase family protein
MIDFHAHLDLYPDPHSVVRRCEELGIYVLSVTTTASAWEGTAALAHGSPRIRTALGMHPQLAQERKHELPLFQRLIEKTNYVGEVGLDGSRESKPFWQDQMDVFTEVLDTCSRVGGRILSIHSRRAARDVLDVLKRFPAAGTPILHWFSGTQKELDDAITLGCWFSVGPAMLASAKSKAQIATMPRARVLTECDGPFARQKDQPLHPWDVTDAHKSLAAIWEVPPSEVDRLLRHNLKSLGRSLHQGRLSVNTDR